MKLGIYCAGGVGRDAYDLIVRNCGYKYEDIFFVDDTTQYSEIAGVKVKRFFDIKPDKNIRFVIASGEPSGRMNLVKKLKSTGFRLETIIDSNAIVSPLATIGDGVIISPYCFVGSKALLGDNVFLQPNCIVAHDSIIGANSVISSFCQVSGNCNIGENVYMGLASQCREKLNIGNWAVIGMGSMVLENVEEEWIVFGVPAKKYKKNIEKKIF